MAVITDYDAWIEIPLLATDTSRIHLFVPGLRFTNC